MVSGGFWGVFWVGVLSEQVRVFDSGFYFFWDLGFTWVLGVMGALLFLGSRFVRALLYIACVRRDALRFFNKVAFLWFVWERKRISILFGYFPSNRVFELNPEFSHFSKTACFSRGSHTSFSTVHPLITNNN
jgi:hypothetical protein